MARPPASRPLRPALLKLLAAAVLAIVALTDAAKPPPKMWVRRPPPAGHKPSGSTLPDLSGWPAPCEFMVGAWGPQCSVNQDFVQRLATLPEYKSYSPWAKSLIVGGIKGAACAKHTTYEACTADVENVCFADFPDGRCLSMAGDQIYAREVLCKGSLQQRSDVCRNKLMLACGAGADGAEPDADGCVRAEQLWYGGKEAYESLKAETEEGIGGRFVGPAACVLESELAATIDAAGELDYDARKEWEKEYYGDAEKGEADILRARGTCEYAQNSLARAKYQNACSSINNAQLSAMADEPMFKGLNQSDTAAMYDCVSKGCAMPVWNGTHILETFAFEADGYLPDFFVSCAPDGPVVWSTRLNQRTDGLMYEVQQACLAQDVQRNQAMCEAVRVF